MKKKIAIWKARSAEIVAGFGEKRKELREEAIASDDEKEFGARSVSDVITVCESSVRMME